MLRLFLAEVGHFFLDHAWVDAVLPRRQPPLTARGEREYSGSKTPFLTVKTTGETPVPQLWPVPQFCHGLLSDVFYHSGIERG